MGDEAVVLYNVQWRPLLNLRFIHTAGGSLNSYTATHNARLHVQSLLGVSQVWKGQGSVVKEAHLAARGQSKPRNRVGSLLLVLNESL
jgi:hypothetical protein